MTGGRAPSFHDLSVGEALDPSECEENSGGGQFPSQISRRKDPPGSPGIGEKISSPFYIMKNAFKAETNLKQVSLDI